MIGSIALPTDFSEAGGMAFEHALALAVALRTRLDLLHVRDPDDEAKWGSFPHVRQTLERWNLLPAGSPTSAISELGVFIRKIDIRDRDAAEGLSKFVLEHQPDLLMMATHGRAGLNRWLSGSVSTEVADRTNVPAMLFGPSAKPFVNSSNGGMAMRKAAVAVDHQPAPSLGLQRISYILDALKVDVDVFHVGEVAPKVMRDDDRELNVRLLEGDPVRQIVAESAVADLTILITAGPSGLLDAIRGSTSERVLRDAASPVLLAQGT